MDYSSILSKPRSFFGKQKVWMARGEDLALFNTHRPNIQNLLRHSCIPESSHNLWIGLYRVGATEEEAKTFIVVLCTDCRIRKLTRDILSSCSILQPGQALDRFKVISKATIPETACEPRLTMQDEQELEFEPGLRNQDKGRNISKEEYKTIRIFPSITGDRYLCRQVQARHVSGKGEVRFQTATAGPLVNVDGRTYQLTVAHVVNFEKDEIHDTIESTTDDWDDWDEDSDDDMNSGCSMEEEVASWDISTSRTSNSDASGNFISSSLSSDSALEVATQQGESGIAIIEATSPNEITIDEPVHPPSSTHPHPSEHPILDEFLIDHASPYLGSAPGSENCQISREMDYLLIPTNTDLQAGASPSKDAELVQTSDAFDIQYETDARSIIIATASHGYMEGVVFPAPSLLRPPSSKDFQALYCIESDNAMPKGTSGSAVFNVPFLVITSHDELHKRSGARNPGFRRGYNLSFLYQEQPRHFQNQNRSSWTDGSYLYPGVCSVIVIGRSERYWTAAYLNDGLTHDTTMLSSKVDSDSEDITKPISPRAYALQALASSLEKVIRYHRQIQLTLENALIRFEKNRTYPAHQSQPINLQSWIIKSTSVLEFVLYYNSSLSEKLDTFLSQELCISPDGSLGNPLWTSFQRDPCYSESLPRIQKCFSVLRDVQSHLETVDGRVKNLMIEQNELLVDNGSPRWFTLVAFLAVMIALIYQMANNQL